MIQNVISVAKPFKCKGARFKSRINRVLRCSSYKCCAHSRQEKTCLKNQTVKQNMRQQKILPGTINALRPSRPLCMRINNMHSKSHSEQKRQLKKYLESDHKGVTKVWKKDKNDWHAEKVQRAPITIRLYYYTLHQNSFQASGAF